MGEVISVSGGPTGVRTPNDSCIAAAEEILEMARSGEIVGLSAAWLHCDGAAGFTNAGVLGGYAVIGAVTCLKDELLRHTIE